MRHKIKLALTLTICLMASNLPAFAAAAAMSEPEDLLPQRLGAQSLGAPLPKILSASPKPASSAAGQAPAQTANNAAVAKSADKPALQTAAPAKTAPDTAAASAKTETRTASADTSPGLRVDDVKIEGNRLVPSEDILKVVHTKRGDKFDREQVVQDLKAINGIGYFDEQKMQGTPELTKDGVLLKIRVQENAPVTEFSIQGNKVLSTDEISKLFNDQLGKPQNLTQLSTAIDKVENAYHQKGYILARVTDVKDDPDGSIGLNINEGIIDGIQIVGNHKTQDFIIRNKIKLKPGAIYNEKALTSDLRKLYAQGYFQDIRRSLQPSTNDPDKYTLKVEVDEKRTGSIGVGGGVDTIAGPFGTMSFSENNFRGRGQVLSLSTMVGSGMYGQLSNTINNAGTNFLSNQRTYQVEANFIEPNLGGTDTSMAVSGFGRMLNSMLVNEAQQQIIGASVNFTKPLGNNLSANLGFTGENVAMKDLASYYTNTNLVQNMAEQALLQGKATTLAGAETMANNARNGQMKGGLYAMISPSLAYDTRDNKMDPTKGMVARVTASPSLGITASSFMKAGASVSKFVPITRETTLAMNIQGGAGSGGLPAWGMYQLGGFNGMRGYRQFSDLGTGSSMLMGSAELRHRIPGLNRIDSGVARMIDKHVKLDTFFDAGEIGGNQLLNQLSQRGMVGASVGFGVRINMPMLGLIRVDCGFPLLSTALGGISPRITVGFGDKF